MLAPSFLSSLALAEYCFRRRPRSTFCKVKDAIEERQLFHPQTQRSPRGCVILVKGRGSANERNNNLEGNRVGSQDSYAIIACMDIYGTRRTHTLTRRLKGTNRSVPRHRGEHTILEHANRCGCIGACLSCVVHWCVCYTPANNKPHSAKSNTRDGT